jgi:hypothetical protein
MHIAAIIGLLSIVGGLFFACPAVLLGYFFGQPVPMFSGAKK